MVLYFISNGFTFGLFGSAGAFARVALGLSVLATVVSGTGSGAGAGAGTGTGADTGTGTGTGTGTAVAFFCALVALVFALDDIVAVIIVDMVVDSY
jgi:hypothetical protein